MGVEETGRRTKSGDTRHSDKVELSDFFSSPIIGILTDFSAVHIAMQVH